MSTKLTYLLELKSTLDALAVQVKDYLVAVGGPTLANLTAVELDNLVQSDEHLKSANPVIVWTFGTLRESPKDPLYVFNFSIGVKTNQDDGNYLLAQVFAALSEVFQIDKSFPVLDYSVDDGDLDATDRKGFLLVSEIGSTPQLFDNQSGIRLWDITAKCVRKIDC
jgi:hypothetical protein